MSTVLGTTTTDRIRRHLVGLKMLRALEALQTTLSRIEQGEVTALEAIEALLGEEYTTRESRRIRMTLQTARLTTVMTGNRGFGEWADIFGNVVVATALLDRLLHHAVVIPIEGNSYQLREHAALMPDHLRGRPLPSNPAASTGKRRPGRPSKEVPDLLPG